MLRKLLASLVLLAFFAVIGGFVALSVWNVPIQQKQIVHSVDVSQFLHKKS